MRRGFYGESQKQAIRVCHRHFSVYLFICLNSKHRSICVSALNNLNNAVIRALNTSYPLILHFFHFAFVRYPYFFAAKWCNISNVPLNQHYVDKLYAIHYTYKQILNCLLSSLFLLQMLSLGSQIKCIVLQVSAHSIWPETK